MIRLVLCSHLIILSTMHRYHEEHMNLESMWNYTQIHKFSNWKAKFLLPLKMLISCAVSIEH